MKVKVETAWPHRVNVLMEIDSDKGQMWIRLYDEDAENLRNVLVPGCRVAISGIVSVYESSGGYSVDEEYPLELGNEVRKDDVVRNVVRQDRFQLNSGTLELKFLTDADT